MENQLNSWTKDIDQVSYLLTYFLIINVSSLIRLDYALNIELLFMLNCKQVLVESEQIQCEAEDCGPEAELEHWKRRTARFDSLIQLIREPRVKNVTSALNALRSKCIKKWKDMVSSFHVFWLVPQINDTTLKDSHITDVSNEAKDNVRYLYTLEKFFKPLKKCSPNDMIGNI